MNAAHLTVCSFHFIELTCFECKSEKFASLSGETSVTEKHKMEPPPPVYTEEFNKLNKEDKINKILNT